MLMNLSLSAALLLAYTSAVATAAGVITVPMKGHINTANLNPASLTKRYLHKRGVASTIPLTSANGDVMYTISLGLGTPPQNFNVAIDTGSPTTWVVSSQCVLGECKNITNKFNCAASSTCRQLNQSFNATYVSGDGVLGDYVAERYTLGNMQFAAVAGSVTSNSSPLPPTVDGIMGLWYLPGRADVPFLNVIKNSTLLTEPIMGIWLETSSSLTDITAPGGEITFGGVDRSRFSGDITYINCIKGRPWTIPVGGMNVNGKSINANGVLATIDTGTTAMLVPEAVSNAINSAIPNSLKVADAGGLWFIPCSGNTPITITFGGFTAKIPHQVLAMQRVRGISNTGVDYCLSAAMFPTGTVIPIEEWLIGDVFLKNVYSVFDFGNNAENGGRIGFAQLTTSGSDGGDQKPGNGNGNADDGGLINAASGLASTLHALQAMVLVAGLVAVVL
ncbi:hypothetical protein BG011_009187 [Mortierella polycephala]|uniref:Peptidase A1 domain-containing protein n=1 Tax=Mortierella polycephala TaxID=41804 RepID=A0A9P6Q943_9FUNG|nr:hypothetical protein BG011_009187 [Mortierella polycephala]